MRSRERVPLSRLVCFFFLQWSPAAIRVKSLRVSVNFCSHIFMKLPSFSTITVNISAVFSKHPTKHNDPLPDLPFLSAGIQADDPSLHHIYWRSVGTVKRNLPGVITCLPRVTLCYLEWRSSQTESTWSDHVFTWSDLVLLGVTEQSNGIYLE